MWGQLEAALLKFTHTFGPINFASGANSQVIVSVDRFPHTKIRRV